MGNLSARRAKTATTIRNRSLKRNSHQQGQKAEQLALQHLQKQGLQLIRQNFHSRQGELDLIMSQGENIVFIEVRQRSQISHGSALESISRQKQQRIIYTAHYYLQQHPKQANRPCRFDVVAIDGKENQEKIQWLQNAFQA